MFYKILTQ